MVRASVLWGALPVDGIQPKFTNVNKIMIVRVQGSDDWS